MSLIEKARSRDADPTQVENRIKLQVGEVVRAYRHSWDIYSELLQNSVDAINRRYKILNDPEFHLYDEFRETYPSLESDPSYTGRIKIIVDIPQRTVEIRDNGVGIAPDKIEEFLLPEGGDKQINQEYGFKGFGLTFASFISEEFYVSSRPFQPSDANAHELHLTGLFDWLADASNSTSFPDGPIPDTRPAQTDTEDWNTIVKVKLAEDYSIRFPAVSSAEQAIQLANCGWKTINEDYKKPEGFEYILRTRTAIGNTRSLFNKAAVVQITVELSVITHSGESVEGIPIPYQYYHPRFHEEVSIVSYDFQDYFERYKSPSANRDFRGLYHTISSVEVGTRRPLKCNVAISAISSTRLSNIEADLGLGDVETGDVDISYGIHLAIDGMPTGLRVDDWDMRGHYLKRYFVVVEAEMDISDQLDPGRKGISKYYARLISDKVLDLLNTPVDDSAPFSHYASRHLSHGRGREEGGLPPRDFLIKVQQVREQQAANLQENDEIFTKLMNISTLTNLPAEEQEVIALFYELTAQNVIKGYRTVYLSGNAAYDAGFEYEIDCIQENIFPSDPLGLGKVLVRDLHSTGESHYVHRHNYTGITSHPELCVDFKSNLGRFLDEVGNPSRSKKDPKLIDLLIFWDTYVPAAISSASYTIDPIIDNQRIFHSTTHRLGLIGQYSTEIFCISLKDVLEKLP